jgi:hypothetical protein
MREYSEFHRQNQEHASITQPLFLSSVPFLGAGD